MQSSKATYATFLATKPPLPIFYQDWWLDAVCGPGQWGVALAKEGDHLAACWPYALRKKGPFVLIGRPDMSPYCGPWISPSSLIKTTKILDRNHRLLNDMQQQLPAANRVLSTSLPSQDQYLPLVKTGWQIQRRYTYVLATDTSPIEAIWRGLGSDVKARMRKNTPPGCSIQSSEDPQGIVDLFALTAKRRGVAPFLPEAAFRRIFAACEAREQAKYWVYLSPDGQPIAALWMPFDAWGAYLIGAAVDTRILSEILPLGRLIWEAIQWAAERQLRFDFEGSSLPGVEDFYRRFGPIMQAYNQVSIYRGWPGKLLKCLG